MFTSYTCIAWVCFITHNRLETETSDRFTDKQSVSLRKDTSYANSPLASGSVDVSRSTSNVFRSGDYNLPLHASHEHFITTQRQDYQQQKTLPPAGVSTATKKAYSHVLSRFMNYMHVAILYDHALSSLPLSANQTCCSRSSAEFTSSVTSG